MITSSFSLSSTTPYYYYEPIYQTSIINSIAHIPFNGCVAVITGVSGFICSHLTRMMLNKGWYVYGIDKKPLDPNLFQEFNINNRFTFINEDICNLKKLPDCDYVINGAAETHVHNSIIDSEEFIHSNVDGVRNLLEIIRKQTDTVVKKPIFFHISTDEVYGDQIDWLACEEDKLNPSSPYSASKAAADMLVLAWARTYGLEYVILRPSNNYGTHQHPEKFIPLCIKLALWGKSIRLHNKGTPKRTWLHVEDTCSAILTLIEKNAKGIYNVSGNLEQTNLLTASQILKHLNISITDKTFDLNYVRPGQDMRYNIDCTKLKDLGWKWTKNFDDELPNIINWYLNNKDYLWRE